MSSFRVAVPVELNLAVTQEPVDAQHVRRPPLHHLALLMCRKVTQADDVIGAVGQVTSAVVFAKQTNAKWLMQPQIAVVNRLHIISN